MTAPVAGPPAEAAPAERLTPHASPGAAYWDDVSTGFTRSERQRLWRLHCDAASAELLARWLPPERVARILKTDLFDEAVSRGLVPLLAARADRVMGIDISPATAASARGRHADLGALVGDVRSLPYATDSFDVVVSASTLDHFRTREELLASLGELHRVLRPGGQLILTLDNPVNPLIALRNALPFRVVHRMGLVPYFVGATLGPRQLGRALRAAAFEVGEIEAFLHCPRTAAIAMAWLLDAVGSRRMSSGFLRILSGFERLSRWPSRFLTGYFVAVRARKPAEE